MIFPFPQLGYLEFLLGVYSPFTTTRLIDAGTVKSQIESPLKELKKGEMPSFGYNWHNLLYPP